MPKALMVVLCLCLIALAFRPLLPQLAGAEEPVSSYAASLADHGHSHDDEDEPLGTLHGQIHDMADHDHSPGLARQQIGIASPLPGRDQECRTGILDCPKPMYRIERPPRA